MSHSFDQDSAKKFLLQKEQRQKEENENTRKNFLEKAIAILKEEFSGSTIEVYLVGSIIYPYKFNKKSDIDIVLKHFVGDRLDLWTRLESKIGRGVEVILYENCHFKEHVEKERLRVI